MTNEQSEEYAVRENTQNPSPTQGQPISLLPFAVQLQNILPVEIIARRFPIDLAGIVVPPTTQLNLGEPIIDNEILQAQITLEFQVNFSEEPRPFEISFKQVGLFSYTPAYTPEMVLRFLREGSLSVMLPSARELLLSICTRLQIPMLVLPLVQLTPPATETE